jgi:hypothetical protein
MDDLDKIEEDARQRDLHDRKKQEMPISGKSVFQIRQILNQKTNHREEKK